MPGGVGLAQALSGETERCEPPAPGSDPASQPRHDTAVRGRRRPTEVEVALLPHKPTARGPGTDPKAGGSSVEDTWHFRKECI